MIAGQSIQQPFPLARQSHNRSPPVVRILLPRHQPLALRPVQKLHRAVVLQSQPLGYIGYGRRRRCRSSRHLQHQLILLRLQTGILRGLLTELQKLPQCMAKISQCREQPSIVSHDSFRLLHNYIVSRYKKFGNSPAPSRLQLEISSARA